MNTSRASIRFHAEVPRPIVRSQRGEQIARWFGLNERRSPISNSDNAGSSQSLPLDQFIPRCGEITLIGGASGSGKSSLLRKIRTDPLIAAASNFIDLDTLSLPTRPLVDCFDPQFSLPQVLSMLSCVGLAEAWTYLRTPDELSEGQRWRLKVAMSIAPRNADSGTSDSRQTILCCDEFAALLDRVTACVVARALRRAIDAGHGMSAILATSHDDLPGALKPDRTLRCDFGSVELIDVRQHVR